MFILHCCHCNRSVAPANAVHCCRNAEDRRCGRRDADGNKAEQAAVLRHSKAILERDDTMVHEQGGRGQVNMRRESKLLLLSKAVGHAQRQSGHVPVPLTDKHTVAQWQAGVAAPNEHGRRRFADGGITGRLIVLTNGIYIFEGWSPCVNSMHYLCHNTSSLNLMLRARPGMPDVGCT